MVCKKCGAQILPDDQFCPECGAKVIRKKRCPECGELYKVGTKFCPHCGAETGGSAPKKRSDSESAPRRKTSSGSAPKRKADPAPPPKKKPVYREAPPRRRRDWEDDDWDDDDDDEESVDVLTIMTVAVGCILLVIVAVLGYNLYQRCVPKNYDKIAEEQQEKEAEEGEEGEENEDGDTEGGQALEEQPDEDGEEMSESASGGTLVTIADVNIRDNPSTQGTTVIKKAKKGDSYEYIEAVEGGAWYQILLPDEDDYEYGYVSADYIEIP